MRIFRPLFAIAALLFAGLLFGCQSDPGTNNPTPPDNTNRVINVDNTTLNVSAEGGDYTIEFTVTNAIGDVVVAAKSEAEWIKVNETSKTFVKINVAYNKEEEPRSATLTLKYPEATDVTVEITQSATSGDPFTFEIKDITFNKLTSDITVQNPDNYYVLYMSKVSYFKEMGIADEESLLVDDYNFFFDYATAYGMSIKDFMIQYGLACQGNKSMEWTGLVPAEDYVVYVYGIKFNEDGSDFTVTTPIFHAMASTPINTIGELAFDVQIEVNGPDATVSVDPNDYTGYYTTILCNSNDDLYISDDAEVDDAYAILAAQLWMSNINSYMGYYNMTAEQILESECETGISTFTEALYVNSDYATVTFAVEVVDGIPMLSSRPIVKNFTTGDVEASDMTFDVELNACYTRVLDFTVTPSTDENYSILILNKTALEGLTTDEEIIDYAVNGYWLDEYKGEYNYYNCYLKPETEYSILVFGYHGGAATTGLTRLDVKTEPVAVAENSVTGIVTYGPYDPVAIAELDPSYANYANYAGSFIMLHWLETASDDYAGVYHYIYDTATVDSYGDQAIFDDLVYYSYYDVMADAGAFDTEYVIAGVVQDNRGNYSDMVYSEPFTYTADQMRDAQEFLDLLSSDTRSGKVQISLVGRNEIVPISKVK